MNRDPSLKATPFISDQR